MRFTKFSIILFFALQVSQLMASEHGEGGATPGEEAKKGGGGQADREWAKRTSKLNVYEAKIKDLTKLLQAMIDTKNQNRAAVDEKGNKIDVLQKIAESHKQLKENVKAYNLDKEELRFRFPEQGAMIERRYVPLRGQTLEQIEREIGLDGELTRTKKKIDKKYATFVGDDLVKPPPQQKAFDAESTLKETKSHVNPDDPPKRIKLSQ